MAGFINALRESLLGHEVSIPICFFKRTEPFSLFYTYIEDHPLSHSLVFRKGDYQVFEIFLPRYGEDIEQLIANAQCEAKPQAEGNRVFGFCVHLLLRLIAGNLVSDRTLLTRSGVKLGLGLGPVVNLSYRLALCRRRTNESVVLLAWVDNVIPSKKSDNPSGNQFSWLKLSTSELKELIQHLQAFLHSKEFADVPKKLSGTGPGNSR